MANDTTTSPAADQQQPGFILAQLVDIAHLAQ